MSTIVVAPDGPPTMLEIGGSSWRILRIGRCLFAPGLTKDVIAKQMITWHDATWVGRRLPDAPGRAAYPVMYCHASGEQAFLTPELAAEIDVVTAEKAGCETTELDREEKQVLAFGEDELRVPIVPKPSELAPEGYVAPVFKKVTKKNEANEDGDDEEDEEDEDEDEDEDEPKKAKAKSKETKKKSAGDKELVSCPWFLGPLKQTGEHTWTPAVTIKTPAGGVSSAAAKKRPAAEENGKGDAPVAKKPKASVPKPTAPRPTAPKATTKPATTKPVAKPVAKSAPTKEAKPPAAKPPAAKPPTVLVPHDMFAPPPRFNAAHKQSQNGNEHSGDSLFVFKKGEHEENVRKFMAYMASSPESPEETRAMVKILVTSARKKPDSIKDNIFRIMGLPPGSWNTDGLSSAAQTLTEPDQERARASFAAMRSVFAELLTCKKAAKRVDASEW
jgi:hypothetical protein